MWRALAVFSVLLFSAFAAAQDLKLRQEAMQLLEHANAVSSPPKSPSLERMESFRVFSDSGTKDGNLSVVVIRGVGRRLECHLGDYDLITVWTEKQVAVAGGKLFLPPDLLNVDRITPIYLVHFDSQDVIRGINERNVNGGAARCVLFDTVYGDHTDNNEVCMDSLNGTLLLEKIGLETIENSDFFPFGGALMPGRISYSYGGKTKIEVTQTMTTLAASDVNVLAVLPNSTIHEICTTRRRPFGVYMPQPQAGNGGTTSDVIIRAMVGLDGHIVDPTVQASDRPDLNSEALDLARKWTFTPAMCNGRADPHEVNFTLHFQGR